MATTNYNLPTFDGADADKPIQYKSTWTQAMQNIDANMHAISVVADGAAEQASVDELNTELESVKNELRNLLNAFTGNVVTTTPVTTKWYEEINITYNRMIVTLRIRLYTNENIGGGGDAYCFAYCAGNPFLLPNGTITVDAESGISSNITNNFFIGNEADTAGGNHSFSIVYNNVDERTYFIQVGAINKSQSVDINTTLLRVGELIPLS